MSQTFVSLKKQKVECQHNAIPRSFSVSPFVGGNIKTTPDNFWPVFNSYGKKLGSIHTEINESPISSSYSSISGKLNVLDFFHDLASHSFTVELAFTISGSENDVSFSQDFITETIDLIRSHGHTSHFKVDIYDCLEGKAVAEHCKKGPSELSGFVAVIFDIETENIDTVVFLRSFHRPNGLYPPEIVEMLGMKASLLELFPHLTFSAEQVIISTLSFRDSGERMCHVAERNAELLSSKIDIMCLMFDDQ